MKRNIGKCDKVGGGGGGGGGRGQGVSLRGVHLNVLNPFMHVAATIDCLFW